MAPRTCTHHQGLVTGILALPHSCQLGRLPPSFPTLTHLAPQLPPHTRPPPSLGPSSSPLSCGACNVLLGPGLSGCFELGGHLQAPISAGLEGTGWDSESSCDGSRAGGPSEGTSFLGLWLETWKEPPCSSKVTSARGQFLPALKLKSCSEHIHVR